jgi:hypothetical protein
MRVNDDVVWYASRDFAGDGNFDIHNFHVSDGFQDS